MSPSGRARPSTGGVGVSTGTATPSDVGTSVPCSTGYAPPVSAAGLRAGRVKTATGTAAGRRPKAASRPGGHGRGSGGPVLSISAFGPTPPRPGARLAPAAPLEGVARRPAPTTGGRHYKGSLVCRFCRGTPTERVWLKSRNSIVLARPNTSPAPP